MATALFGRSSRMNRILSWFRRNRETVKWVEIEGRWIKITSRRV